MKEDRGTIREARVVDPHSLANVELNEHEAGKDLGERWLTISSST